MAMAPNPNYFPAGFASGFVVRGVPLVQLQPGLVWWVSNSTTLPSTAGPGSQRIPVVSGSDGNKGTWNAPFATLNYALTQAHTGDIIFVKPGHAETLAAAAAVATVNDGVAVIGLGAGNQRPTFTMSATTSTISIVNNSMIFQNLLFLGTAASTFTATVFNIANAQVAKDLVIDNCEFRDNDATHGFIATVKVGTTANIADGLTYTNNKVFRNLTSPPAANTAVVIASNIDRLTFSNNTIINATANNNIALGLALGANNCTNTMIAGNRTQSLNTGTTAGELMSSSSTASSGLFADNYSWHLASTGLLAPTGTKMGFCQNFCSITGAADKSALINPSAV